MVVFWSICAEIQGVCFCFNFLSKSPENPGNLSVQLQGKQWFYVSQATTSLTCEGLSSKALFTQDAQADLCANLHASPLMLLATCVNTPINHNVFPNWLGVLQGAPRPVWTLPLTTASCVNTPINHNVFHNLLGMLQSAPRPVWTGPKRKKCFPVIHSDTWRQRPTKGETMSP